MPMHVNGTTDVQIGSDLLCILVLGTSKALHKGGSDDQIESHLLELVIEKGRLC